MSHFTKIRTRVKDLAVLKHCLTAMGYAFQEGRTTIKGYQGQTLTADLKVTVGGGYQVGFVRGADGAYDVVADWWGVQGVSEQEFSKQFEAALGEVERAIRRQYAFQKVSVELEKEDFSIIEQEVEEDGTVRLLARRYR